MQLTETRQQGSTFLDMYIISRYSLNLSSSHVMYTSLTIIFYSRTNSKTENGLGSDEKKLSDIKKSGHVDTEAVTSTYGTC